MSKPSDWRVLLVKDVLARLRLVLWCPDSSWESARGEIDGQLNEAASVYWSKSVLRGTAGEHPDAAWQEQAWKTARPHDATDRLRIRSTGILSKTGWFDAPTEPPWALRVRRTHPRLHCSIPSRVEPDGRRRSRPPPCNWPQPANESPWSTPTWMRRVSGRCSPGMTASVASCGVTDYLAGTAHPERGSDGVDTEDYHHRSCGRWWRRRRRHLRVSRRPLRSRVH